jgi:hypothetical protein
LGRGIGCIRSNRIVADRKQCRGAGRRHEWSFVIAWQESDGATARRSLDRRLWIADVGAHPQKGTQMHTRIFENVVFSVLITVFIGWTIASVANAASPSTPTPSCTVAKVTAGINRS